MAKNQAYKAFTVRPSHVLDLNGVLLDRAPILSQLATEVRGVSAYATYVARNDAELGAELAKITVTQPAEAGRLAGIKIPDFLVPDKKSVRTVNRSRMRVVSLSKLRRVGRVKRS